MVFVQIHTGSYKISRRKKYNDKYYFQISGTAMGTKMAPTYATLTMGFLEEAILKLKLVETFGINTARNIQDNRFRFLDDCIILWKPDFGNINSFIGILNILHPKIKVTQETDKESIPFLNIIIYKEGT